MKTENHIVLAGDELPIGELLELTKEIGSRIHAVKVHNQLDEDPDLIRKLTGCGAKRVIVDYKIKDIPNTAQSRAKVFASRGAYGITVHADGEIEMIMAAIEGAKPAKIIVVSMLTSLDPEQVHLLSGQPPKAAALYRARMAMLAKAPLFVCSPEEVGYLSKRPELKGLQYMVPGIRSAGADKNDQKRVGTPVATLEAGAKLLVIGRQITTAPNPTHALDALQEEIEGVEEKEEAHEQ
jgi:orotidine-5'-phosphate decarboxylase